MNEEQRAEMIEELRDWRLVVVKSQMFCDRDGEMNALAAIAVLEALLGITR
jgi:hypothetical protein